MEGFWYVMIFSFLVFFSISFLFGYILIKTLEMIDLRFKITIRWIWHIVFSIAGTWYLFAEWDYMQRLHFYALLILFVMAIFYKLLAHTLENENTIND
jgi:hypothetical protein